MDDEVVEFANSVAFEAKVGYRKRKKLLYQVASKYLPNSIIYRPKIGFHIPLEEWFVNCPELRDLLSTIVDSECRARGYYNIPKLECLLLDPELTRRYAHSVLFPILSFELWIRDYGKRWKPISKYSDGAPVG